VVEYLPDHTMVKGSSLAAASGTVKLVQQWLNRAKAIIWSTTGCNIWNLTRSNGAVVEYSPDPTKVKGSSPAVVTGTEIEKNAREKYKIP